MTTLNSSEPANLAASASVAAIPRKRWLRIIPPILLACIISYMDRVNIAFAMPGGMSAGHGEGDVDAVHVGDDAGQQDGRDDA